MEYLAVKRSKLLIGATTLINLKSTVVSEKSQATAPSPKKGQAQKGTYCMVPIYMTL